MYRDISRIVKNTLILRYLEFLLLIVNDWDEEYVNTRMIDGDNWRLTIIFMDGNKREYYGRAKFPNNFEELETLNQKLVDEVM